MAKFYDTLIGEYVQNPGYRGLSLDDLALRFFDYEMISYKEITDNAKINFKDVDVETAAKYSIEDVYLTRKLYDSQKTKLSPKDREIIEKFELPLMDVLSKMEQTGVKLNLEKLQSIGEILKKEIKILEDEIYALAGENFNINSPKQVGNILFEKMGIPPIKKTKTGYSVSAQVLEELSKVSPIAKKIVTYRHYSKLLSTYVEGLSEEINPKTGRIHTNYNQTVAATGRLSSTGPNMQNIPSTSGIAGEIRGAFVPFEEGDKLVSFDYSQVEVRLLAIMSGDENLISAYTSEEDIHDKTAKLIFNTENVTSDQRKVAKTVNFGIIYGVSSFGLTQQVAGISAGEAKEYIEAFYSSYPGVRKFFDETIESARENGYVETMFGRKRKIDGINDRNKMTAKHAEREAINTPIQGTAADIIKLAMIECQNFLEKENLKTKMIIQVHDELVFNVPESEMAIICEKIPYIMENVINEKVPLKVDSAIGNNWKEAK